jgi:hypothetical protein
MKLPKDIMGKIRDAMIKKCKTPFGDWVVYFDETEFSDVVKMVLNYQREKAALKQH